MEKRIRDRSECYERIQKELHEIATDRNIWHGLVESQCSNGG